jgi:N-acyl homoserine lactone hydrolase
VTGRLLSPAPRGSSSPLPAPATLPLPGGTQGATVTVEMLRTGHVLAPPGWFYREEAGGSLPAALGVGVPRSAWIESPNGAFLVRHPGAGAFLIDTGIHEAAAGDLVSEFGRAGSLAFRSLVMAPDESVVARLAWLGIDPAAVELVVMTHLHVDHTSAMRQLAGATFICAAAEWEAATARGAGLHGYRGRHLPPPGRVRTIDFLGVPEVQPYGVFARTLDLFGDGAVRLVYTPGHTIGHTSVLVRLDSGECLLAGDAVYTTRSLAESLLPLRTADDGLFLASLDAIRAFQVGSPGAPVIPTHDAETWRELRRLD